MIDQLLSEETHGVTSYGPFSVDDVPQKYAPSNAKCLKCHDFIEV